MAFLDSHGLSTLVNKVKDWVNEQINKIKMVKAVNGVSPDDDGNVNISTVDYAFNLVADDGQASAGDFIYRTTGGSASLSDGDAYLSTIRGNSVHMGYVPEELTFVVENAAREDEDISTEIQATLDKAVFKAYVNSSQVIVFEYLDGWNLDLATYGISVTGIPIDGDKITVTYVKEELGTITVADPTSFKSTGWNLYKHTNEYSGFSGLARVLNYHDDYGFIIEGDYTNLYFSETLIGTKTLITPTITGEFSVESDGYIWVTGGNASNTCIYMTWSDWINGHDGSFAAYSESEIDLSGIMSAFPYGLCKVGTTRDYIDFDLLASVSNIEVLEYNNVNLTAAKNSGREYDYDNNYIYLVRDEPVIYYFDDYSPSIDIDGSYIACDHGIEFFESTNLPCYAAMIYGQNLKDKLRTDVVTKSSDIANNLTTTAAGKVLDARQGKTLNDKITNNCVDKSSDVANNLTTTAAGKVLDARQGKVLNDKLSTFIYESIESNTDLNSINEPGFYGCSNSTIAKSLSHTPITNGGFVMLVMYKNATYSNQIIFDSNAIYTRAKTSNGWLAWYKCAGTAV